MQLRIATTGAPLVPSIDPSGVNVSITFNITAAVVLNETQVLNVFQLSNTAFAAGDFAVENRGSAEFIVANLTFLRAEFETSWVCACVYW